MPDLIIDDATANDVIFPSAFARGYEERDYTKEPVDTFKSLPSSIRVYPRTEWDARIDEQTREESSLTHIRNRAVAGVSRIPSLDQNGQGYCWAYSTAMAIMLRRATMNQPYVRLSGHAVACKVKNFKDEGGWCGLSAKFAREHGFPDISVWPEKSMNRSLDNAATWENAKLHMVTDDYADLALPVYDNNLTFDQVATCLLNNVPVMLDFNWWGHSVCGMRLVRVEAGSYGIEILNSWTDAWGTNGTAVIRGNKVFPDGAVGIITTTAA